MLYAYKIMAYNNVQKNCKTVKHVCTVYIIGKLMGENHCSHCTIYCTVPDSKQVDPTPAVLAPPTEL